MSKALQKLVNSRIAILDGGMGHELLRLGIPKDTNLWSAIALIKPKYHSTILQAHTNYLEAGCDIITTSNYSATPLYLSKVNKQNKISSLTQLSVQLADQARKQYLDNSNNINNSYKLIAGSVPPLSYSYCNDLLYSKQSSIDTYCIILENLLLPNKIDFILAETLSGINESMFIYDAILKLDIINNIEYVFSFSLNNDGLLHSGESFNDVINIFCNKNNLNCLNGNLSMLSINCSLPESINIALNQINEESIKLLINNKIKLGIYPNGFHFIKRKNIQTDAPTVWMPTREDLTETVLYNDFVKKWIENDKFSKHDLIGMIGGCCSVFPKHIEYIVNKLKNPLFV